jgi:hypothetical protein
MWFQHWIGKKSPRREFRGLYSAEQLQQALRRERARADRFEQTLSLLSLGVSSARTGRDTLVEAAAVLRRRLRLSDEAGWLDRRHIGVLMPNTPPWGAWTLADELCLAFRPCVPLPQCRVYSYPSDWFATGEHSSVGADRGSEDEGRTAAMEPLFFQGLPWWKRAFDILAAGLALLAHVPILLGIAVLIKLTSRGPVLFRQTRVGLGGRPFTIYKFRTMFVDAERLKDRLLELNERDGPVFKT